MDPRITILLLCMGALSLLGFLLTGWDKRQAIRGGRRVPEKRLHLFELLGGWPGVLAARVLFRHKTRKLRYRVIAGLCTAVHVLVVLGLYLLWRD